MQFFQSHKEAASALGEVTNHLQMIRNYESGFGSSASITPAAWDKMCWEGVPLEMINSVNMNFSLNFLDVSDAIEITVHNKIQRIEGKGTNSIAVSEEVRLPLYVNPRNRVRLVFSTANNMGPLKDLVSTSGTGVPSGSVVGKLCAMTSGADLKLLSASTVTIASAITTNGVDMRKMALKAIMMKNQLIMMHTSRREYALRARKHVFPVTHQTGSDVINSKSTSNIVINMDDISSNHRPIIAMLAMAWPCQTMTLQGNADIYSQVEIQGDTPTFYSPSGCVHSVTFSGCTVDPKTYWSDIVQIFNTLGGLSHLAQVCRETRGLVPCLVDVSKAVPRGFLDINLAYGDTRCMSSIDVGSNAHKGNHVTPSELESSGSVLMVDNLMVLHMRNNMHYFCESIGLFSRSLVTRPITECKRVKDILHCHGLRMRGYDNPIYSAIVPWLCSMAGGQEYLLSKIFSIALADADPEPGDTRILPSIGWKCTPSVAGTTQRSLRSSVKVTAEMQSGIHTNRGALRDCLMMSSWAKSVNLARGVPKGGVTYLGVKTFPPDHNATLNSIAHLDGVYCMESVIITIRYPDYRVCGDVTIGSFFNGDIRPKVEGGLAPEGTSIVSDPKRTVTSSFCVIKTNDSKQSVAPSNDSSALSIYASAIDCSNSAAGSSSDSIPTTGSSESASSPSVVEQHTATTDNAKSVVGGPLSDYVVDCVMYVPGVNEFNDGNCGVGALRAAFADKDVTFDVSAELGKLSLSLEDRLFLYDDHLGAIAASKGYNLAVIPMEGTGNVPRIFTAEGASDTVCIFGKSGHYQPAVYTDRPQKRIADMANVTICAATDIEAAKRSACRDKLSRQKNPGKSNTSGFVGYEESVNK